MHRGRLISYTSRQLKPHEVNYLTYDLELEVVFFSLKISSHNIYGFRCTIFTNHRNMRYLMD